MNKAIFCFLFLSVALLSNAQPLYDSVNHRHNKLAKASFTILTGWSAANLVTALIGQNNSAGETRQFYKRTILWSGINLGLSGLGYLRLRQEQQKSYSPAETFKRSESAQKIFLLNAGLDLAYAALALYTKERATNYTGEKRDRLRGTGNSLLMQSCFLALFDGTFYFRHNKNGNLLETKLRNISFSVTEGGLGLVYRF